jgi:hypothetical protein
MTDEAISPLRGFRETPPYAIVCAIAEFIWECQFTQRGRRSCPFARPNRSHMLSHSPQA